MAEVGLLFGAMQAPGVASVVDMVLIFLERAWAAQREEQLDSARLGFLQASSYLYKAAQGSEEEARRQHIRRAEVSLQG